MRGRRAVAATFVAALLAGCGDPVLWSRWQAERALYHAARSVRGAEAGDPREAGPERAAAQRRLDDIVSRFPASRWGAPPAHGPARDVALASARASLSLARLAASAGEDERALQLWREALARWSALPGVVVTARAGSARALDRLGRFDEALRERMALALLDPLGDPDRTGPVRQVLDAPVAVAAELRELGRPGEAAEILASADATFAAALSRARPADASALAGALARIRLARGNAPGALAALRHPLATQRAWERPAQAVALAACALEGGVPDSAISYARWAASATNSRTVAGAALLLAARAWEAMGRNDSAFATYDALFDRWTDPGLVGPEAHFRRARLLEQLGQWQRARAEFVALAAAAPSHPYAFKAMLRVVEHHVGAGELDLARLEGENAVERMDYLLSTNRDARFQREAGVARAELLSDLGSFAPAESSLVDLWRRFPEDSTTQSGALRAASLAERRPGGRATAVAIYEELARRAISASVRRTAARNLGALGSTGASARGGGRP